MPSKNSFEDLNPPSSAAAEHQVSPPALSIEEVRKAIAHLLIEFHPGDYALSRMKEDGLTAREMYFELRLLRALAEKRAQNNPKKNNQLIN